MHIDGSCLSDLFKSASFDPIDRLFRFLPEAHQFISAAGVSSLVASVIFVVFLIVRFVRARMRITPWTAERYAEMTSTSPVTTGWSKLGHSVRRGAAREHKSPTPMMSPPQSARSSQARNLVFSTSEDTD